jgi:hypothetical protein
MVTNSTQSLSLSRSNTFNARSITEDSTCYVGFLLRAPLEPAAEAIRTALR